VSFNNDVRSDFESRTDSTVITTNSIVVTEITADTFEVVASKLTSAAGSWGTDAIDLHNWLLWFGKESEALLREEMASANPSWAAYRAMMACRLNALDNKHPGVRPVGIGKIYRHLWVKFLLKAIGRQVMAACVNK
jgi:hypothetical protein